MNIDEFIKLCNEVIMAYIKTSYRDDLDGRTGYIEIPKEYQYSGDIDRYGDVITKGSLIYGDNIHGNIFLVQKNGEYENACDFSTIYNTNRYIMTFYNGKIMIFKDDYCVPSDIEINYYLYDGYLSNKNRNIMILPQDSKEYYEVLNAFSKRIWNFASNRGLFRTITPEKTEDVQGIVDSDCFILLHSGDESVAYAKIANGFWNKWIDLKNTLTYNLDCSQPLRKIKKGDSLTAYDIINYTYHPKGHPSTIIFAIPNEIFDGFDKCDVYEAIIDFKEYDPLVEKESKWAKQLLSAISSMPDGEEKVKKQRDFLRYYGKYYCPFVPKDLIAGILNAQGELWLNPEWIVLQPNRVELISIHRQRLIVNINAKTQLGVKFYSDLAPVNRRNRHL